MVTKVTRAYIISHGDRTWYVSGLPEGKGDYEWTKEINKALNLTDHQAKRFSGYAKRTWGSNGRWGVQSYFVEVVA